MTPSFDFFVGEKYLGFLGYQTQLFAADIAH
jgi:hypothetical protein